MTYIKIVLGAVLALITCTTSIAYAASFNVVPVRIYMSAERAISSINVKNTSDEKLLVQSGVSVWEQPSGTQILTPTKDVIISPPIFEIEPGSSQIVRVAYRGPSATDAEQTYRLTLTEVPVIEDASQLKQDSPGIQVALRLSLPIFITPRGAVVDLRANLVRDCASGEQSLALSNQGNRHIMLVKSNLRDGSTDQATPVGNPAYLLRDSSVNWALGDQSGAQLAMADEPMLHYETVELVKGSIPIGAESGCVE